MDPFYSRVEAIFRVSGRKEGWPGFPMETSSSRDLDRTAALSPPWPKSASSAGMKFSKMRTSLGQNGLASSVNLLLPDAMATGKLQLVSNAIVREVTTDKNTGLANGAHSWTGTRAVRCTSRRA